MKNILVGITEEQKEQLQEESKKLFGISNVSGFIRYLINNALNGAEPTKIKIREDKPKPKKKAKNKPKQEPTKAEEVENPAINPPIEEKSEDKTPFQLEQERRKKQQDAYKLRQKNKN